MSDTPKIPRWIPLAAIGVLGAAALPFYERFVTMIPDETLRNWAFFILVLAPQVSCLLIFSYLCLKWSSFHFKIAEGKKIRALKIDLATAEQKAVSVVDKSLKDKKTGNDEKPHPDAKNFSRILQSLTPQGCLMLIWIENTRPVPNMSDIRFRWRESFDLNALYEEDLKTFFDKGLIHKEPHILPDYEDHVKVTEKGIDFLKWALSRQQ